MTVVSRKAALASTGMAHLAGTGPVGKVCRDCDHMTFFGKSGYCAEYRRLTRDKKATITGSAHACNKFKPKTATPAAGATPAPAQSTAGLFGPAPQLRPLRPLACRVPGCGRTIDPWTAFCGYHWHGLPASFQERLAAARKSTDPAALPEAIHAAVEHIEAEEKP